MKPISEMNPTELLRYQVELLERLVSAEGKVTVVDFDISFTKLFGLFLKALPAALLAYVFAVVFLYAIGSIIGSLA